MSLDTPALAPGAPCAAPGEALPTHCRTAADLLRRVVAARDLDKQQGTPPAWLWHSYLGPGKVTLLTSQWKSGKTTLVSLLLARLQQGGQLAGLAVTAAKALVISEESEADWRPRFQQLGIRDHVDLLCRPFTVQPSMEQWLALIETAAALHQGQGSALVVLDSLAHFLPAHSENSAGALLECLTPLQRLATAGMSVLLVHHPRKGKTMAGQSARGSGALPGFVDILIEMEHYTRPDDLDRRRRLVAYSRHDQTPRHLLIELFADGSDYVVLQSGVEAAVGESWQAVLHVLTAAHAKLTRQEILDHWPRDYDKPNATTLWRWLTRAAAQGLVRQEGTGRPNDPFRYWLPEREELMRPEGGTKEEMEAWNQRMVAELFGRLEPTSPATPAAEVPVPGGEEPKMAAPVAASEETSTPLEQELPATTPPFAAAASEAPVRLPYPFNLMNPAKVPAEVWKRARGARGKT